MANLARAWKSIFGTRSDHDGDDHGKKVREGTFSPAADEARAKYFEHKKAHPDREKNSELTPLQRRMHSGDV